MFGEVVNVGDSEGVVEVDEGGGIQEDSLIGDIGDVGDVEQIGNAGDVGEYGESVDMVRLIKFAWLRSRQRWRQ